MTFYPEFFLILSKFYPDKIMIWFGDWKKHFLQIEYVSRYFFQFLFRLFLENLFYPNFIQIISRFYPTFIQTKFR